MTRPDQDLRGFLEVNRDAVTVITKPVQLDHIGALSAQSERPILFDNIAGYPDFRLCDILVKHRWLQARALGVAEADYLRRWRAGCACRRAGSCLWTMAR